MNFNDQWRIKLENGQIKGPFPIESVCKMIVEGILTGQEEVAQHPSAEWRPLSKQSEFYEALLESLENPTERDEKKAKKMDAETVIQTTAPKEEKEEEKAPDDVEAIPEFQQEIKQLLEGERKSSFKNLTLFDRNKKNPHLTDKQNSALIQARDKQLTIELSQLKKIQARESKKFFPFVFLIILIVGVLFYYFNSDTNTQSGWILIAPNKSAQVKPLTPTELKSVKAKAIGLLRIGTLENAKASQKFLVQAIEGAPTDLEAMGLLCAVYEQLWPYTKQTANDTKAVTIVTQMIRGVNPLSSYSDTCQSVYMLTKGQPKDARGLIERTLDQKTDEIFTLSSFLYLMKGQILEDMQNYLSAEAYYTEAAKSFPKWNWALFAQARVLYKQNKFIEAQEIYTNILRDTPQYKAALFGMALAEIKSQSNIDRALNYFNQGYVIENKLPKVFHLEALQEYIKILMSKGDNKKALEVAQFGLTISPSHRALKEVVISLGGEDRGNNAASELVFLGDQFVRSGDHLAAQAQYKAAFEFDKTNGTIALKAAKSLWMINQTREALNWVDRAIRADMKMAPAYALKADYLSQKFNFVEASKTLSEAIRATGQNYDIIKTQALVEFRKNNMATAVVYGEKALKMYDADVELLTLLANANISMFLNSPSRSKEDDANKQIYKDNSHRYANRAVDLEPGLPEAQITYSKFLFASRGSIAAENNFKKLIETFPYTYEYRIGLAEFYELQEKYKFASEVYLQLVEVDPKNKKALMGLARSYQSMNNSKDARKYYMNAAVIDPSDVEPLFATAQLELETSTPQDGSALIKSAYAKFKMVKDINPNYPRISYFIARCHYELGEFDKAIELINDEKKKNPGIADPYILAATVYNSKEQYKECAAEYSMGIKLRPTSAELYVKAAICYRKSEAYDIASDMLEIAYSKESGFPPIHREQAYLLEATGHRKEAKEKFQLYLELSPNALDRSQIEAKISALGG